MAAGLIPAASAATAADPLRDGLVAEYLFEETSGDALRNTADGDPAAGDPLDAVVRNYAEDQRSEAGTLRFLGGAKTSTGNWVELPDDILADAQSATVSIDVKADPTMLNTNHFLWNIGNDATQEYWFATARAARSAITTGSGAGEKNGTGYALTANRWHSLTAVIDAEADTLTFYTDGQRAGVAKTTLTPADITQSLNTIGRAPGRTRSSRARSGLSTSMTGRCPTVRSWRCPRRTPSPMRLNSPPQPRPSSPHSISATPPR
nr:hypothetical protein GCM10025699_14450 [Microbacterium flavescens]